MVRIKENSIHVAATLGDLAPHAPIEAFGTPLRMCAGSGLKSLKLGIRYSLFGRNLRRPAKGTLRLQF